MKNIDRIFRITRIAIVIGIIIYIWVFMSGCNPIPEGDFGDPDLMRYVEQFRVEAANRGIKLPDKSVLIVWDELDHLSGHCQWGKNWMTIKIDPDILYRIDEYSPKIEATVFHELTHGYFGRGHTGPWKGIEPSLMAVPDNGRRFWLDGSMRDYYLDELFGLVEMKDLNYLAE